MERFAAQQVLLYKQNPSWQCFFEALQMDTLGDSPATPSYRAMMHHLANKAIIGGSRAFRQRRKRVKADVLLCPTPYFSRESEMHLFLKILIGIAKTGRSIACLMPRDVPCSLELNHLLDAHNLRSRIHFIDLLGDLNLIERPLLRKAGLAQGEIAFDNAVDILMPHCVAPGWNTLPHFQRLARFLEAWQQISDQIEFESAVTRCHWMPLCAAVSRTAIERGKRAITFQQGVIGHSLDAPVTASDFVAFGDQSAVFLNALHRAFFAAVGTTEPQVSYHRAGCLFDPIVDRKGHFSQSTLLVVDYPSAQIDFYGVQTQIDALFTLMERFLAEGHPSWRVIVRPHPHWQGLNLASCQTLANRYPGRCEISHPSWPLDEDLNRSSAAIGIFSGVLTVASASGMPSYFLKAVNGFATGDLACFEPEQILDQEAAWLTLKQLFTDPDAYEKASATALRNARAYYANGANARLDEDFFQHLLSR